MLVCVRDVLVLLLLLFRFLFLVLFMFLFSEPNLFAARAGRAVTGGAATGVADLMEPGRIIKSAIPRPKLGPGPTWAQAQN